MSGGFQTLHNHIPPFWGPTLSHFPTQLTGDYGPDNLTSLKNPPLLIVGEPFFLVFIFSSKKSISKCNGGGETIVSFKENRKVYIMCHTVTYYSPSRWDTLVVYNNGW